MVHGALVHWCIGALVHWCIGALTYCSLARLSKGRPSGDRSQGAWVTQKPVGIAMPPLQRLVEERVAGLRHARIVSHGFPAWLSSHVPHTAHRPHGRPRLRRLDGKHISCSVRYHWFLGNPGAIDGFRRGGLCCEARQREMRQRTLWMWPRSSTLPRQSSGWNPSGRASQSMGEPSGPEPPGAPRRGAGAELGHCQGVHSDHAQSPTSYETCA